MDSDSIYNYTGKILSIKKRLDNDDDGTENGKVASEFLDALGDYGLSKGRVVYYAARLPRIVEWLGNHHLELKDATKEDCKECLRFITSDKYAGKTNRAFAEALKRLVHFSKSGEIGEKKDGKDYVTEVSWIRPESYVKNGHRREIRPGDLLTAEEIESLLDALPKVSRFSARDKAMVMCLYEGAQGIKVQSTGTDFKASATQDDFFGLRYASGALAANGQGTQNNAFISGQSIGSDYMWSQSLIQSYGNSGITYSTYTCVRYDSSNYTCYFPDEIVLKASQQFETGYGGGFFPCPWGWTTAQGNTHCYKINEGSEMTKDIGNAGKKRFDLNTYHEIMSDGKVKAIQKIRTCTSYTAGSCGSYETIRNFTTETVANSNQRFFCDSVGGTTYCPSSASVGWEGGSEFRPRSGTYVEHTYQINTATATESYKTGNVAPAESNKDICWWDSIDKSGSTNYKSTYTHNTASNCHS
jgi:hypothetical protein